MMLFPCDARHTAQAIRRSTLQYLFAVQQGPILSILHGIRQDIKDDVKDILSHFHHIPAPDTDQCALSRLGLSAIFAQQQPYNIKSTQCQLQASPSSQSCLNTLHPSPIGRTVHLSSELSHV